MKTLLPLLMLVVPTALAQAPVEEARVNANALQQAQQKAGFAHREMQRAEFEVKQAEQDLRQADADHKSAQKRADELKRIADTAKKNRDAAKAKETAARKAYDDAVNAVSAGSAKPAPK